MKIITIIKSQKVLLVICLLFMALNGHAKITHYLQSEDNVATVNDWPLPKKSVELFYQYVAEKNPEITQIQVVKSIIENHLLAKHAKKTLGLEVISDQTKVGFKQEHASHAQFINIIKFQYQEDITLSIQGLNGGDLNGVITRPLSMTSNTLSDLLSMGKAMEYRLSPVQIETLKNTQLLKYQFPKSKPKNISLWDIYDRTNVQEKIVLFKGDMKTLTKLIQNRLSSLYIAHWVKQSNNIEHSELLALQKFISDNRIARQYHLYTGSKTAVHHSNQALRALAKKVTPQEIEHYYQTHIEDFKTIKKVKARHIQLGSQEQADHVYQALEAGLDFTTAIKKYSQAKDKHNQIPGNLGWISRKEARDNWLHTLPFTQKKAASFSRPFMSPKKHQPSPVWEIIYLDERVMGYLAPTSKTVQYNASKAIAKLKVQQSFKDTQKALWHEARVNLNKSKVNTKAFEQQATHFNLFNTAHQHDDSEHGH
jgi:hypothetical protein